MIDCFLVILCVTSQNTAARRKVRASSDMPDMTYYSITANAYISGRQEKARQGRAELRSTTTYDVSRAGDVDRVSTLYLDRCLVVDAG